MRRLLLLLMILVPAGYAAAGPASSINNIPNRTTISLNGSVARHRGSLRDRLEGSLLRECQAKGQERPHRIRLRQGRRSQRSRRLEHAEEGTVFLRRPGLVREIIFLPQARAHPGIRPLRRCQLLYPRLSQRRSAGRARRRLHAFQLRDHGQDSRRRQLPGRRSQQCPPPRRRARPQHRLVELWRAYSRCRAGGGARNLHSGLCCPTRQRFKPGDFRLGATGRLQAQPSKSQWKSRKRESRRP